MAGLTILVVDDEAVILDLASLILSRAGYTVLTARDGLEGISVFENKMDSISLLLTDVQMPKMDGLKLATAAQSIKPNLNVIFMSGYAPTPGISEAVLDSRSRFLPKPFSLDKLEATVLSAISK